MAWVSRDKNCKCESNPVKILNLVRLATKEEKYGFGLSVHGLFINGWTYRPKTRQILPPGWKFTKDGKQKRVAMVKGGSIRHIRDRVEKMIEESNGLNSETSEFASADSGRD